MYLSGQENDEIYTLDSISFYVKTENELLPGKYYEIKIENSKFTQYRRLVFNKEYEKRRTLKCFDRQPEQVIKETRLLYGEFYNGERFGKWLFYFDFGLHYCWENMYFPEKYISYRSDTVVVEDGLKWPKNKIFYVCDSTIIYGQIETLSKFPIEFKCNRAEGCKFWYKNTESVFNYSEFSDFESTIKMIEWGYFDRKIRQIIDNRELK